MCRSEREANSALAALEAILGELGLQLKHAKTRIVHLREGGQGFDFLGFWAARAEQAAGRELPRGEMPGAIGAPAHTAWP